MKAWIMSEGGPLICLEQSLKKSWGGIDQLSVTETGAKNDYDRACSVSRFLETRYLPDGTALIIGDAPYDTRFWRATDGALFIVRIIACTENFDERKYMEHFIANCEDLRPVEELAFRVESSPLVMFDSAGSGLDADIRAVSAEIVPGTYRISTHLCETDDSASLIVHQFHLDS